MKLLDLFCGAGGAAMGYSRAGFNEIVGVDIVPQPNYPFTFIQGDALHPPVRLEDFDLIHASPPCQAYSTATPTDHQHPELIPATRELLKGHSSIIENVIGAPLRRDVLLCGSMFGLRVQRHRVFELNGWFIWGAPACRHIWPEGRPWSVVGRPGGRMPWHLRSQKSDRHSHKYADLAHAQELLGVPWMTNTREAIESIPPAYTEYLGRQFLDQLARI